MNSQTHYDNHANDIEYFNLHKPRIEVKRKSENIADFSDDQLVQKLDEANIRLSGLYEIHKKTNDSNTLESIGKLMKFRTAIRIEMRNRKVDPYHKLKEKIGDTEALNLEIKNLTNQVEQLKQSKALEYKIQKEVEKTKRHEINIKNDKYACAYLLEYVRNTVSKEEYDEVLSDLKEIREKETPH